MQTNLMNNVLWGKDILEKSLFVGFGYLRRPRLLYTRNSDIGWLN